MAAPKITSDSGISGFSPGPGAAGKKAARTVRYTAGRNTSEISSVMQPYNIQRLASTTVWTTSPICVEKGKKRFR